MLLESERASQIIERTRAVFAKRPTRHTPLNLNDVVTEIVRITQPRLREGDVVLDLKLSENLVSVLADAVQMQQVLLNLVINAGDALRDVPPGRRRLRISTRQVRNVAVVDVRDSGPGFPPHARERLFEPFHTTKTGGTGMGLAICRSIMESHGGSLTALKNAGDGATFRIKLPVAESPASSVESPARKRVLIVDDHDGMRASLTRLVQAWGHEVAVAADAANALTVASTFKPEAAVIDISLEGTSGLDLARRLREDHRGGRLHLIALTAYRDDDIRQSCFAAGFDTYLIKPEGIQKIQQLLGRQ
jgi:CheY-like chemotaxis protein